MLNPMSQTPRDPHETDDDSLAFEVLKRALEAGKRTVRSNREKLEHIAQEILNNDKVEAVGGALNGLREDAARIFGRELARYFDRLDLTDALVKVLTSISLELKTEIRFIPNDKKLVKPDIKSSVSVKGADD